MPPISPCGQVVDFLRSCQTGFWRFFPGAPDILTAGYHYFAADNMRALETPHSFGSAGWLKDGMFYPNYPTGQVHSAGAQWYNGQSPEPVPPDQQIFDSSAFASDLPYPPSPAVQLRGGFDARCFVVVHPGVDIDVDAFLRPDITDCCWQRVLARLIELLTEPYANALNDFRSAVALLWPGYRLVISRLDSIPDRWAWIEGPTFQIVLRIGTQNWQEIFRQAFHLNIPAHNYGNFSTSQEWYDAATDLSDSLTFVGFDPAKPMVFVGHSRGGAILWILGRRTTDDDPTREVDVLTFGCPRVGDFRMRMEQGITRSRHVMHRQDVIPIVPPNPPLWPALRTIFSWLDVDAFASWSSFPLYQITGDGWRNGMNAAPNLTIEVAQTYIQRLRNAQPIEPVAQHMLSSYVAALADCCDAIQFPFSRPFWDLLFGADANAIGGEMVSASGLLPGYVGGQGLALGGPSSSPTGHGGLKIGGAGVELDGIITESGIPIVSESGSYLIVE